MPPTGDYNIDYPITLSAQGDFIRVRIRTAGKEVVDFVVQYEATLAGRDYPVIRYDGSHGYPHLDVLDQTGHGVRKLPLPEGTTYAEAVTFAIREIKANWRAHRAEFRRRTRL